MPLTFLSPSRTVLQVADEALYIYTSNAKGPRLVETVPWDAENFEENVAEVIRKDCGGKPTLILNDMVEQHYRKERVTRSGVSVMDRANMLKRKLQIAFPNYPVRAAYALKEKAPKAGKKGAADIYIFAALPESKQFNQTIGAVNQSLASVSAFTLLPVEASDMIKMLSTKLLKKGQSKTQWIVFMGQHKHGGLRQIVIKNGELALTRMTPVVDNDHDAEAWAGEVFQEFNATMSYLTRFGFQQEDGLHIIALANSAGGEALQGMIEDTYGFSSLTSAEAARLLNLPLGQQDDYRYADPLHVAWTGRKSKFILPMRAAVIDNVSKPRKTAMAASFLLCCGAAFFGYQLLSLAGSLSSISSQMSDENSKLNNLNVQYEKEVKRKEELGFDVRLVQSSIGVYDGLERNNIKPLMLYNNVGKALGKDMRVDRITIEKPQGLMATNIPAALQGEAAPMYQASMQMTYPSTSNIDKGNKEVEDLRTRLQTVLPDHKVEITKRLKDYEYVEEMVVETGDLEKKDATQDFIAEITIKGPPKNAEVAQ